MPTSEAASSAARPTPAERADAADALVRLLEEIQSAITEASKIVRQRQPNGSSNAYPMFTWGSEIQALLTKARDPLFDARKYAVIQAYDERRKADKEAESA